MLLLGWVLVILVGIGGIYQFAKLWYWRHVNIAQSHVHDSDGRKVPSHPPKPIVGNIPDVYKAENRLSAYNAFHQDFGNIVQIMWLWRHQISLASYPMALRILGQNQHQYEKFPPNALLQKLYGTSVLTNNGQQWKQHRLILNEFFTEKAVLNYHPAIVQLTQRLLEQWRHHINVKKDETHIELCQSFNALFLDIVTQITVGQSVGALDSQADGFLESLTYILKASTQPQHQFISWWRFLPLPQNHRLSQALKQVDDFLEQLITQHQNTKAITKATEEPGQVTILDKLLQNATETGATETGAIETSATETSAISSDIDTSKNPLTHAEIKDNLLAIIGNGYETVATTLTMTLQALAQHPSTLALARQEAQEVIERHHHQLTPEAVGELSYIESVLYESMRLYPAVAGLQRISRAPDILEGWSIPAQQVVGITLQPLHLDPEYYGKSPETFRPERYLTERLEATLATSCCPFKRLIQLKQPSSKNQAQQQPLTFGYGARQCLAKHLALYEMKVVLAMVLNDFYFELTSDTPTELELGKFGLFISAFPKTEIKMKVYPLPPNVKEEVDFSSLCYGLSSECEQNRNSPERALAGM